MDVYRLLTGFGIDPLSSEEIVPGPGQGLKVSGLMFWANIPAGEEARLVVRESVNAGSLWTPIFISPTRMSQSVVELSDVRALIAPSRRQAPGSTNLRYRVQNENTRGVLDFVMILRGRLEK